MEKILKEYAVSLLRAERAHPISEDGRRDLAHPRAPGGARPAGPLSHHSLESGPAGRAPKTDHMPASIAACRAAPPTPRRDAAGGVPALFAGATPAVGSRHEQS